jgi:putative oxidoreductase
MTDGKRSGFLTPLTRTSGSLAPLVLRLTLAFVMWPHGAQKALGWYGGYGWSGTVDWFTQQIGVPSVLAMAIILLEFLGPIFLALGLLTRLGGLAFAGLMVGAIVHVHAQHGFFMNWYGQQAGEGYEYHLLAIGIGLALAIAGGGLASVDRKLSR